MLILCESVRHMANKYSFGSEHGDAFSSLHCRRKTTYTPFWRLRAHSWNTHFSEESFWWLPMIQKACKNRIASDTDMDQL
jgi:hypothetical protein